MHSFNRLFNRPDAGSSDVAKNRLQQVLVHDRVNLSPGKMDHLKHDLAQVISRYVEIDQDGVNIFLTATKRQSCLTAQVPVVGAFHK
ncbi:MAG: cell division topological specificity factor MinE [Anaerolineae bacterium]|nr:cell division topological specificity factor MinE [Anaerolineae bacterium]